MQAILYTSVNDYISHDLDQFNDFLSGVGMFVCTYVYMYVWVYTGEVNAKRIRENYLKAILRQDITFFDNVGAGEVATRIQTDTRQYLSHKYFTHSSHDYFR